jgi:hypothetical protein
MKELLDEYGITNEQIDETIKSLHHVNETFFKGLHPNSQVCYHAAVIIGLLRAELQMPNRNAKITTDGFAAIKDGEP